MVQCQGLTNSGHQCLREATFVLNGLGKVVKYLGHRNLTRDEYAVFYPEEVPGFQK